VGIRNAVINQFNPLALRDDVGKVWESFCFSERGKHRAYSRTAANTYFWRTYDQQEIDLVEEREGQLWGYARKWSPASSTAPPRDWRAAYPTTAYTVITAQNYQDGILPPR
jgi:uncharacterized protein